MPRLLFRPFALLGLAALMATSGSAQTASYSVLANFTDNAAGAEPLGNLVQAPDGNFYGEDIVGGPNMTGVVYQVTPGGVLSAFYAPPSGGMTPTSLIVGGDGNFYGLADSGGANGYGSIFKISPAGALTVIYNFKDGIDGGYPSGTLVQGSDGNYYGVASQGGDPNVCQNFLGFFQGCGTVFKITPSGTYSVVYTFQDTTADYGGPVYGLVQGLDGNFYGVTAETVFQVTPGGSLKTIGVSDGSSDGIYFNGPLVEGSDGAFYGTAQNNGANAYGTVFEATVSGGLTVISGLCSGTCPEGGQPVTPLFAAGDGNFYGTTYASNNTNECSGFGCGAFFQVNPSGKGKVTALYTADDATALDNGILFGTTVVQGSDGDIYGAAGHGGTGVVSACGGANCGIVFKAAISPTAPPPVVLTLSTPSVAAGTAVTLSYKVNAANSLTKQQCYAFVQGGASAAGAWTGKQAGTYSSSTFAYSGSKSITPTASGTYTYALTCGGVVSGFATLKVTGGSGKASSTTTLSASPNPATIGQTVTLKATVSGSSGTPTGTVALSTNGISIGDPTLSSSGVGTITASTNGLAKGAYPVIGAYSGSTTYNASTSAALDVTLNAAPTSTTMTASPTSVTPPASVTLTATVKRSTSGAAGTPGGSVTFATGSLVIGTVSVNASGVAMLTAPTTGVPAGSYPVTAKYNGDASDLSSTATPVTVVVK